MLACLRAEKKDFPKDAFLMRTGDTVESIGFVLSGSVLVIQEDVWGNRNILSKAGAGQTFAAAYACAPGSIMNVSVAAETPVTAMFLNVKRADRLPVRLRAPQPHDSESPRRARRKEPAIQ